jgi:hypothetical protein
MTRSRMYLFLVMAALTACGGKIEGEQEDDTDRENSGGTQAAGGSGEGGAYAGAGGATGGTAASPGGFGGAVTRPTPRQMCGNGMREPGEACDGYDLAGETCASLTMGARPDGTLGCDSSCAFNVGACASTSGFAGAAGSGTLYTCLAREPAPAPPPPEPTGDCGSYNGGPYRGYCVEASAFDNGLWPRDSCAEGELCVAGTKVSSPGSCFTPCTSIVGEGACVPTYIVAAQLGTGTVSLLTQDTCHAGDLCVPCLDPVTTNARTGACDN